MFHEEKRDFRRMQIHTPAKLIPLEGGEGKEVAAICTDLSATGLAVQLDDVLEIGSLYRVLIASTSTAITSFDATAKVVRATKEQDGSLSAGLEIVSFN
ncbi:PilZ domain-containing protein [Pseudoalteromonas sp. Ps84H-4]|uniref:PilZ domain-containing protein n=1 Tax=Pseudoalteromonas sp. Ps84H-4 TaxID=2954502 RepID=UPI000C5CE5D1|nr:PilZ domain-containing protein [Pseudoalteromonas sp. Ps84H-4]MBU76892.1 PilZ domain-containing protein [Pseudoalteromonadaceae bacterium]MCO7251496.1 PilZ domain-containing protein [Pseudoalteromonas sp. Ps84H-4]|tara:strand:+ start:1144 stop:1440 length:297 start_codon:yes stop_codon:yes gene_type:complete